MSPQHLKVWPEPVTTLPAFFLQIFYSGSVRWQKGLVKTLNPLGFCRSEAAERENSCDVAWLNNKLFCFRKKRWTGATWTSNNVLSSGTKSTFLFSLHSFHPHLLVQLAKYSFSVSLLPSFQFPHLTLLVRTFIKQNNPLYRILTFYMLELTIKFVINIFYSKNNKINQFITGRWLLSWRNGCVIII